MAPGGGAWAARPPRGRAPPATAALMLEEGYAAVTTRRLAQRAGV
ncbi:TetR family transcriptional regulator, partial [Frankia sp. AgB1.8]